MSFIPKPHEIYRHFKGDLYQITAIAQHTETGERLVVYQALYGDFKTYARPLSMFVSRVDKGKYPHAAQEFRFELQEPDAGRQRSGSGEADIDRAETMSDISVDGQTTSKSGTTTDEGECAQAVSRPEDAKGCSQAVSQSKGEEPKSFQGEDIGGAELSLDPMVLEFLDSDSYEQRLNILAGLHHRITDEMITVMAIACDVEINDGDIEERYEALKYCLLTLERYECNRLR